MVAGRLGDTFGGFLGNILPRNAFCLTLGSLFPKGLVQNHQEYLGM